MKMALHIFPPEIWELVMGELQVSSDILNAFKAFPELEREGIMRKTRVVWRFGQIFPFMFPWLGKVEVFTCREVCREWSGIVDKFLENYPKATPKSHDLYKLFQENVFDIGDKFTEFLQRFSMHYPGRNPIIGRYIKILDVDKGDSVDQEMFWHQALEFVRSFGEHIWFLDVAFSMPWDGSEVPIEMLRSLPNLRGLTMSTTEHYSHSNPTNGPTSPFLPYLETLKLDTTVSPECLAQLHILQHFSNIRRLRIFHRNWRKEYFSLFPKLTELTIVDMTSRDGIRELFHSLNAPHLCKLAIRSSPQRSPWSQFDVCPPIPFDEEIVSWLGRFPHITSFTFSMSHIEAAKALTSFQIASLTSLTLNGTFSPSVGELSMLRYFPRLGNCKITWGSVRDKFDDNENVSFCKLDENSVYELDVWDFLPKLKWISVKGSEYPTTVRYSRARWEYLNETKQDKRLLL